MRSAPPSPAPSPLSSAQPSRQQAQPSLAPDPWSHPGDWQQLQRIVGKECGWSIERHRIASDQYDVKACYHREQPDLAVLEASTGHSSTAAAAATERPASDQQALLTKLDSQSRSAVKRAHNRLEKEAAPEPPSAAECVKTARRVVAKHLWLLARRSKSCQVDDLIEQVLGPCREQVGTVAVQLALRRLLPAPDRAPGCSRLRPASANPPLTRWPATSGVFSAQVLEHSDLGEEAVLAAVEQIVIRRDKLQRHLVRLEGDTLILVPPAT